MTGILTIAVIMSVWVLLWVNLIQIYAQSQLTSLSVFGRRTSMSDENVKTLFSSIDDFMDLQQSPSSSFIDGFPIIAKCLPKILQWYRPKAERIFRKTVESVHTSLQSSYVLTKVLSVYGKFFKDLDERIQGGDDPQCFSRELLHLAKSYEFDDLQKYFCGKLLFTLRTV